jgi:VWFA-related protein
MKRTLTQLLTVLLAALVAQAPAAARQQPQQTPAPTPAPTQTPQPAATPAVPSWIQEMPAAPAAAPRLTDDVPWQREEPDEDDVVRITSNLVQIDAVVTDKKGRLVTDLKSDEFEILADDRPQQITNFSYVSNVRPEATDPSATPAGKPDKSDKVAAGPPPARLRPEDVRRTVAFVFNDLQMSWESVYYARRAITKFLDEQMQPGDFVAIIPTSGGSGALQQFTSDKRMLYAAVKNLRWYPQFGVAGIRPFEQSGYEPSEAERYFDSMSTERFSVGTLNALEAVVGALRELPGRKSLVMLSDGIPLAQPEDDTGRVLDGINRVIESANRASVIIYAVDSRGLQTYNLFDASVGSVPMGPALGALISSRSRAEMDSQRGMRVLAEETGGVAYLNSNDIGGGVRRALEDQKGYYLVGYRPEEGTFDPATGRPRYHKLTLRVTRPGLKVRTRRGFFGFTGKTVAPAPRPRTRAQQMRAALVSPFPAGGVSLRLTSLYASDRKQGPYVRSLLYIDPHDISFSKQVDGTYRAVLDVVALTFGAKGLIVGETNVTHTVTVKEEAYQKIQGAGLLYQMAVPAKKPGGYQLRVAVRDTASERVGSASQYVEVPDLKKGRLALSGIVMQSLASARARAEAAPAATPQASPAPTPTPATAPAAVQQPQPDPQGSPAVRRFRRNTSVDYAFNIYNSKLERAGGRPRLQTQMILFHDGKPIFTGQVQPFDAQPQNAEGDIGAGGQLSLGAELAPGEYVLQMIVTDLLAKEKERVAVQWIDFEVVE